LVCSEFFIKYYYQRNGASAFSEPKGNHLKVGQVWPIPNDADAVVRFSLKIKTIARTCLDLGYPDGKFKKRKKN
jgi:hypothetical protein